ncbi:PD-(D/E)XK nuclease family protein [Leptolyngbyaceae cyanobacterium UHCC 1019]
MTLSLLSAIRALDTDNGRIYETPIGNLPGVNTILDATESETDREKLRQWHQRQVKQLGEIEAEQSAIASRERGTAIHAFIADFLTNGTEPDELPLELLPYWKSIRCWLRNVGESAIVSHEVYGNARKAIELPIYHPQLGYGGTLDWVGEWEVGDWWLADFKTSNRPKRLQWMSRARLQIAAYRLAFTAMFDLPISKAVIPVILPDRPAQIFELTPEQLAADEARWLQRLELYKALQGTTV